ncbi:MAG: DUF4232 domain-containing protein [Solirubrobacteraceae bacterium]
MPEQSLMRRSGSALVLALMAALLLAACGSAGSGSTVSSSSAGTSTAAAATPATSASTATASSSTTTTTTTTTTTASGPAPCRAADLSLSFLGQQGGMGHGEIGFQLHNTSADSCRTYGYPGILFLDQHGGALPTIPHHTTNDFFGSTPAAPLVIAPGASASFRLDVGHGVATANGCATAYALQVIPPNDTATLRTTIPNGSYECRDANVSPLQAGTSAYP